MFRKKKKEVIAYLHTHWDREWYREFEVFRLRLLRVFDHVLSMLEQNIIPSFYFDGQVVALLDYLEMRPEKETLIRQLIAEKKLFIGPFYCLVDEFLTDGICFRKNLEIGLKVAQEFGCTDFIGYLADTFGHSQNIPEIFQEYGIDKAIVWRGCGKQPANFKFGGINTVNLIRGYFMDIFSLDEPIDVKAKLLKDNLDKISKNSGNTLLLPIGADHLDVPEDIVEQIKSVNRQLSDYELKLGSPFEYFDKVDFKDKYEGELRDNSKTFILPGAYSSRLDLKRLNIECSYMLDIADKLQYNFGAKYTNVIEYAYKLLLQNQAHDSICGCSTDEVHQENIIRYKKILQIAKTIIEEIRIDQPKDLSISFRNPDKYKLIKVERTEIEDKAQIISKRKGFPTELLHSTDLIPVTEDYTTLYTLLKEFNSDEKPTDLKFESNWIGNSNIKLEVDDGKINLYDKDKCYPNFIEFIRCKDLGDSYNFGPDKSSGYEIAQIKSAKIIMEGDLRIGLRILTSFFSVDIFLNKHSKLVNFNFKWVNLNTNKLWQIRFNLNKGIKEVYSEDMNMLICRKFDQNYDIRKNLPTEKGLEAKTNTAPFQRFVWTNGLGIITKGITEYEVFKNALGITILRSTGIISNPRNPARTTPAGPPIEVHELQMLKEIHTEFAVGFFPVNDWVDYLEEMYPQTIIF
jgi:hypothetical protein